MKHILITISFLLVAQFASANADLVASMKIIGEQFGLLGQSIQQQQIGEAELSALDTLQREVAKSALLQPDKAVTTDDKLAYSKLMAELMEASFRLEDAMNADKEKNPVSTADSLAILLEMNELRKEGHTLFR